MSKEKTKKMLLDIQEAVKQLLDRKGKKLRCGHGLCLEIADILGYTFMEGLDDEKYFGGDMDEGFMICNIIDHVMEIHDIKCDKFDLVGPKGVWTPTREQICDIILRDLGSEEFLKNLVVFGRGTYLKELLGRKENDE